MTKLLLLALAALCAAQAAHVPGRTADMDYLHKQKKIYELLLFVKQSHLVDADYYDIGRNYDIESNKEMYKDKAIVDEFLYCYKHGMLQQNAIFSPYYEEHRDEMVILFKLFYTAKDFLTFYKTAAWARIYLNDGAFTSALTVAVFYRPDCKNIRLPAPYEIYPNFFFDSKVIQEAHTIQMTRGPTTGGIENVQTYTILANYTGAFVRPYTDDEYKLDYFIEDVGLNAFYYYFRQVFPFWLDSKEYDMPKEIRGSFYYFIHQQLVARYQLERISNGLGGIEDFEWNKPFYPGYYSSLMYPNGIVMPQRDRYENVPYYKYKYLTEVKNLESRIMGAIDMGVLMDNTGKMISIYTPEGMNLLGNIIEGNMDSCNHRYYGMYDALARDVLGFNFDYKNKNKEIPSALQCYSTSMRDPGFYRLYKKIISYFLKYKKHLPYYTTQELLFPGVKIENVNIDKLQTYFDYCDTLINNAIAVENMKDGTSVRMKARRYCLNYKPFTYRLNVNSDKDTKAVLKIFLGPAFDAAHQDMSYLRNYYNYFVELDQFVVNLRPGANTIERRSSESVFTMPDMQSGDMFYKKLQKAVSGSEPFTFYEKLFGFPERLTLPKGTADGTHYKMFFYLTPLDEAKMQSYDVPIFGKMTFYGKPFGFPLDRPMQPWKFVTPNMYFKDVFIYHSKEAEKTSY